MIVSTSLIRRREDIPLDAFRRHWLDPHGPLTAKLPGARRYDQNHVIANAPGTNAVARAMRIDGFPILAFDSPESRRAAHGSDEMAACNRDSLLFIGAVARVIGDDGDGREPREAGEAFKQLLLVPKNAGPIDLPQLVGGLEGICGAVFHRVLEQGAAPNSAVPFIGVEVEALAEVWTRDAKAVAANAVRLEDEAAAVASFAVEVHRFF